MVSGVCGEEGTAGIHEPPDISVQKEIRRFKACKPMTDQEWRTTNMIIDPIEFTLKDGRKAVLRSVCDDDIQGMLDYLFISSGETDFILRYPEECTKYTPEGEKALFDRMNASETDAVFKPWIGLKKTENHDIL